MSAPAISSSSQAIKMVTLKDGTEVSQAACITTMINIQAAINESFVALYDLVEKCKDSSYQFVANPFGDSKSILTKYGLIEQDERVHDVVKSIVLNGIDGEGVSLQFVDPRKIV